MTNGLLEVVDPADPKGPPLKHFRNGNRPGHDLYRGADGTVYAKLLDLGDDSGTELLERCDPSTLVPVGGDPVPLVRRTKPTLKTAPAVNVTAKLRGVEAAVQSKVIQEVEQEVASSTAADVGTEVVAAAAEGESGPPSS